ncbi:MAG: divalent-cation tolerance protein CutA [Candidatus Neomarinimicrobiota bacterium]
MRNTAKQAIIVLTNAASETAAETIALELLEQRLAACVNILPAVKSFFRWEGSIQQENEVVLLIKTTAERQEHVFARIRQLHAYAVPEIIAVKIDSINQQYREWLENVVQ